MNYVVMFNQIFAFLYLFTHQLKYPKNAKSMSKKIRRVVYILEMLLHIYTRIIDYIHE